MSPASKRAPATGQPSKRLHFWHCVQNHEWLCSPKGAGFLYARREMGHLLAPLVVSWGWQSEQTTLLSLTGAGASLFVLQQGWQGTRDIAARLRRVGSGGDLVSRAKPGARLAAGAAGMPRLRLCASASEPVQYARQAIGPDIDLRGLPDLGGLPGRHRRHRCRRPPRSRTAFCCSQTLFPRRCAGGRQSGH